MNLSKIFLDLYHKNIELDVIVNSILVYENVRNSFLLELGSKNYDTTIDILLNTFKIFKPVILKDKDHIYGILITKNNTEIPSKYTTEEKNIFDITNMTDSHKDLGIFLSYPCAGDDWNSPDFFLNIDVLYEKHSAQLIGMACTRNKNISALKDFINQIKKCIESINSGLKKPIKIKVSFNKKYTIDDIIKYYLSGKINKTISKEIQTIFFQGQFIILNLLYKDKIFDFYDKKFTEFIVFCLNICKTHFDINCVPFHSTNEEYYEWIRQNTCKYTKLVIGVFNDMYGIKIDEKKYLNKTYDIINESILNMV